MPMAAPHFLAVLVLVVASPYSSACTITPVVDRHLLRNAMDASLEPVLGWTYAPSCGEGIQQNFRVSVADLLGNRVWTGPLVQSNLSDAVPFDLWTDGRAGWVGLAAGTSYQVQVAVTLSNQPGGATMSSPTDFHTQLTPALYASAQSPLWHTNTSALFVMFRRTIPASQLLRSASKQTFLAITAKPSRAYNDPHGVNTSHLLCAYKLWVNGVPLGTGPGRIVGHGVPVDTYVGTACFILGRCYALNALFNACNNAVGQMLALPGLTPA
jgi:hypothetical protein